VIVRFLGKVTAGIAGGLLCCCLANASVYPMPKPGDAVFGRFKIVSVGVFTKIAELTQKYDVGYHEFVEANPGLNMDKLHVGNDLLVPGRFILPVAKRKGIVINLPEMRLYYFDTDNHEIVTFPVGIGKIGWATPLGKTQITNKKLNPTWRPTRSVKKDFFKKNGFELPNSFPPGPENPLGHYAMRLGFPNYLIHGTNDPAGVGKRVSAGCVRMFNEDVGYLFELVTLGTPVNIVNQPYEAGWQGRTLFFEAQAPIGQAKGQFVGGYKKVIRVAMAHPPLHGKVTVNWALAKRIAHLQMSTPQAIGGQA
jgi:L,D-transpeptidase ErfK/SrfK